MRSVESSQSEESLKKKHTHVVPMGVFLPVPLDYALANQLEMEKSMEFRSDV